jgi:hypothetical protein
VEISIGSYDFSPISKNKLYQADNVAIKIVVYYGKYDYANDR